MTTNHPRESSPLFSVTVIAALLLGFAMLFPMVTDEAYYIDWARRQGWPALGFFDHPPMVSWIASVTRLIHDIRSARAMVWLINMASIFFVWKTARIVLGDRAASAATLLATSVGGIAASILLTPDTGMILCWNASIYLALRALRDDPRWWIAAGAVAGLGLWSKYTMVLVGPVFLWGIFTDSQKKLADKWPWLGALTMTLVFLPHVWWQSQNQWLTFRFQFGHGFSIASSISDRSGLPAAAEPKDLSGREYTLVNDLMKSISQSGSFGDLAEKPSREKSKWEKRISYFGDFAGGVLGLWGVFVPLAAWRFLRTSRRTKPTGRSSERARSGLITAAALFPLIFFGLISPFSKIEANWPAMHMSAMAILIVDRADLTFRQIRSAGMIHLALLGVLIAALSRPDLFGDVRNNRMLRESKGFSALGSFVESRFHGKPVAVDSYQLKSAIAYYAPDVPVTQWPGITRGSEYTRGAIDDLDVARQLLGSEEFPIISMTPSPRVIPGYLAQKLEGVRVCPDGGLDSFSTENPDVRCQKGVREWWITTYSKAQKPR